MVAKFLDDNKSKRHLKSGRALFQLHRSYLISLNLSNDGEIFWVESERTVPYFRKRKRKFLCYSHRLHKAGAVVQQRLRNVQKSVMHVQSCSFANLKPIAFLLLSVAVAKLDSLLL